MTTQYLEAAPVDETLERAKNVSFARFIRTLFFGAFYILGWVTGRLWLGAVYCAFAVQEGFIDGAGKARTVPRHVKQE